MHACKIQNKKKNKILQMARLPKRLLNQSVNYLLNQSVNYLLNQLVNYREPRLLAKYIPWDVFG